MLSKKASLKQLKQLIWHLMSLNQLLEEECKEHLHALKKTANYQKLSETEESILSSWILDMDRHGLPLQ